MKCRHCGRQLSVVLLDLGSAPPSNAYLTRESLKAPESWYPLRVMVCESCLLVQTQDFASAEELFNDEYSYFSSYSTSWLAHAERYVEYVVERFQLNKNSHVVEVAANDGYLLQYVKDRGIPCTGIEPTESTATVAREKGLDIVQEFFGTNVADLLSRQGKSADLLVANNVLAHVPDINGFVAGCRILLKSKGIATFEFPHLMRLIEGNQFDTIYHEHFSYFSLSAVDNIFREGGLTILDVEELMTHGGSLRVFAARSDSSGQPRSTRVDRLLKTEVERGMRSTAYYAGFQARVDRVKHDFLEFLIEEKRKGNLIAAYGAAAKGNTLMNYAGIRPDLISFVVDRNPSKQGKFMPGSRVPIVDEAHLRSLKPEVIVILPWNLQEEIVRQLEYTRAWGARLVTVIPKLEII